VLINLILGREGADEALRGDLATFISTQVLELQLSDRLEEDLKRLVSDNPVKLHRLGLACLNLFVQINWLNLPSVPVESIFPWLTSSLSEEFVNKISDDGNSYVESIRLKILLVLARVILIDCRDLFHTLGAKLWSIVCALTIQTVLEEKSDNLYSIIQSLFEEIHSIPPKDHVEPIIYLLEARFYYAFHFVREAGVSTDKAATSVGLKINDTGALGKRTKFQTRDIAQYTLDLELDANYEKQTQELTEQYVTTDLKLNSELRLEKISFKEQKESLELDHLQQSVLLSRYLIKQRNLPSDELTNEEILPHLSHILENPVSWSIHNTALFFRSKLESKSSRSIDRARAQLEMIIESYNDDIPLTVRCRNIYTSGLPPKWVIEKELASVLLSLGCTKAALDIYLSLESWDEVIVCYNILQMRHRSAEIIKTRLAEKETGRLWCQLGDATDDIECYHKALQITNNKSARAFKSLALHHYFRKEYESSITFFTRSLECSRFQLDALLRLGFAGIELDKWEVAAQAYRSYCSLESDNFEAWNNLAKCYIKLNQKERAWRVLQEAIRCDFDNWKVWDNILVISTDLKAFDESIRAFNRILDIKETHDDDQILGILCNSVIESVEDSVGEKAEKHRGELRKLLARLTVAQPREPGPWYFYGSLLINNEKRTPEDLVRGCQNIQKSLACHTGKKGWDKELEVCQKVLLCSRVLIESILETPMPQKLQLGNSARLALSSALKMIEKSQTDIKTGEILKELQQSHLETKDALQSLMEKLADLKQAG